MNYEYKEVMIVEAVSKPEWGPGKIVHVSGGHLHIYFRDLPGKETKTFTLNAPILRVSAFQNDPILDNLPPFFEKDGQWQLQFSRIPLVIAERTFLRHFPLGFSDPKYAKGERSGKDEANRRFDKQLELKEFRKLLESDDIPTLVQRALSVKTPVNELLAPFENAAFHDAIHDLNAARTFFSALLCLLESLEINAEVFEPYIDAVLSLPAKKSKVASWHAATLFPHIAQPGRHMFHKPERTKAAAETLGFDLHYDAALNWQTYDALLKMGDVYLGLLKDRGAKDYVDVQSFIFVAGGGYDA
ncbi:MAG: hypothetical protein ABSG62_00480 [Terracidiphilus sp.]|jgi:hypothetical protein